MASNPYINQIQNYAHLDPLFQQRVLEWNYGMGGFAKGSPAGTRFSAPDYRQVSSLYRGRMLSNTDSRRSSGGGMPRLHGGVGYNPTSGWENPNRPPALEVPALDATLTTGRRLFGAAASGIKNTKLYNDIYNALNQSPNVTPATSGGGGGGGGGGGTGPSGGGGNQPPAVPVTIRGRNRPVETGATLIQRRQAVKSAMASSPFAPIDVNDPVTPTFDEATNTWGKSSRIISAYDPTPTPPWAEEETPTPSPFFTPSPQKTGNEVVADPSSWTPPMTIKPLPQTQPAQQEEASPKPAPKQRKTRTPKKPKAPKES